MRMIDEGDNYQCRLAVPEDIASLANLRWRLCTDDAPVADPNVKKEFIEKCECTLSQMAGHKGIVHFIAETGGTVIAVLSIVKVTKMPSPNDINGQWGYLTNVYTLPEYRNKGIGTALLSEARDWAENEQLELLVAWPSDISYPFYERFGFSRQQREQDPLILIVSNGT